MFRKHGENSGINLGQCNDGSRLTSANQGVNQSKIFIDTCINHNWV